MKFYVTYCIDAIVYEKEIEADRCVNQGAFTVFKKGKKEFFCVQTDFVITINTQSFNKKEEKNNKNPKDLRKEHNAKVINLYLRKNK